MPVCASRTVEFRDALFVFNIKQDESEVLRRVGDEHVDRKIPPVAHKLHEVDEEVVQFIPVGLRPRVDLEVHLADGRQVGGTLLKNYS